MVGNSVDFVNRVYDEEILYRDVGVDNIGDLLAISNFSGRQIDRIYAEQLGADKSLLDEIAIFEQLGILRRY